VATLPALNVVTLKCWTMFVLTVNVLLAVTNGMGELAVLPPLLVHWPSRFVE